MTAEEKKHYNNGFILGMTSKGVIQKTIIIDDGGGVIRNFSYPIYMPLIPQYKEFVKEV